MNNIEQGKLAFAEGKFVGELEESLRKGWFEAFFNSLKILLEIDTCTEIILPSLVSKLIYNNNLKVLKCLLDNLPLDKTTKLSKKLVLILLEPEALKLDNKDDYIKKIKDSLKKTI